MNNISSVCRTPRRCIKGTGHTAEWSSFALHPERPSWYSQKPEARGSEAQNLQNLDFDRNQAEPPRQGRVFLPQLRGHSSVRLLPRDNWRMEANWWPVCGAPETFPLLRLCVGKSGRERADWHSDDWEGKDNSATLNEFQAQPHQGKQGKVWRQQRSRSR